MISRSKRHASAGRKGNDIRPHPEGADVRNRWMIVHSTYTSRRPEVAALVACVAAACALMLSASGSAVANAADGPITITAGGTYSGNWLSTTATPAVTIATNEPVTIRSSTIT